MTLVVSKNPRLVHASLEAAERIIQALAIAYYNLGQRYHHLSCALVIMAVNRFVCKALSLTYHNNRPAREGEEGEDLLVGG